VGVDILSAQLATIGRRQLRDFAIECGFDHVGSIAAHVTFREWCEDLGRRGLRVDGIPFTLQNRPSMWHIYDLIPSTVEEAKGRTVVMQKCAQVGFTVMEMLATIFWALKFEPCKIGMYLPDMKLAQLKSTVRFMPILRTVPDAYKKLMVEDASTGRRKTGEGNVMARQIGDSNLYFLWTSGKATTESMPMDILSFDEVQEMTIESMEKTRERLSASKVKFTLMGSTANWPDADINFWFKKGTQHQFHTACAACGQSSVLDEHFPDCIAYDDDMDDWRYQCTACKAWIEDPQQGKWIAKVPSARIESVHYPQFLSPTISAREMIESYHNASDMKNFYNRKLGKPFTDPSQVPVTLEHLNACVAAGKAAGVTWKKSSGQAFMGIDNMGGFACAVVLERAPDGRPILIHAEQIHALNPWARLDEIMRDYRVAVCVCEQLPNYDSAKQFASRHAGRVFLVASYKVIDDDMLQWGDATLSKADRKTDAVHRDRYTVSLDQYKMMSWAFARITSANLLMPDPNGLSQEIVVKGQRQTVTLLSKVLFEHFTRTALVTEQDEEEHKLRRRVVKIGIDPHFSFSLMMGFAAWCRAHGTGSFIMPTPAQMGSTQKAIESMPGLPAEVVGMMTDAPHGTCGSCYAFAEGKCSERMFSVAARDAACSIYISSDPSA